MQYTETSTPQPPNHLASYRPAGGGRVASDRYRRALELGEAFTGLEPGFGRFDLLLLVKRAGRDAGFTTKMVQLIEYYLTVFTRDLDWEQGRPIVYQSLSKTALDLGVSERHIQKLEKQLFEIGAIGYVDSGNCKRYGQRDPKTGAILWAFGVDLSPLAHLRAELEERLQEKELYNRAWHETKRQISWRRRQIRSLMLEWREGNGNTAEQERFERDYQAIAYQLRTHIRLEELRELLTRHQALLSDLTATMGVGSTKTEGGTSPLPIAQTTPRSTSTSARSDAHYKYTNQSIYSCRQKAEGFQESVAEGPAPNEPTPSSGAEHVTLKQVASAVSGRFRGHLPMDLTAMDWSDVVEGADRLRGELGVSQASWGEACGLLGRSGAALCVLVTDRATLREDQPARLPAAYFRGLVNRARRGELRLHNSVFGLLSRSQSSCSDSSIAVSSSRPASQRR
ncbi:plasmid replication protein RepC [Botrimarina hoheduenensis]|uniref:Uncharacterized protein n=1 Tax=Botrimarina hoheduenensis TaxID=2528000 RepID=A0A5C5W113_9BACT|nr:plasmid replication protein RepC [Botrimarina hoheduenensis]TWT43462.1 hypothetical protein Pla111_24130 [Botrimarina hoheduenensis]